MTTPASSSTHPSISPAPVIPPVPPTPILPPIPPVDSHQLDKEYDCFCFNVKVVNASPRVVFAFIISVVLVIIFIILIFTTSNISVFVPVITGIVAFWLPSPLQSSASRKDATTQASLLQSNAHLSHALTLARPNYLSQNPMEATRTYSNA